MSMRYLLDEVADFGPEKYQKRQDKDRLSLASMAALGCRAPECVVALERLEADRTRINFRQFMEFCNSQASKRAVFWTTGYDSEFKPIVRRI